MNKRQSKAEADRNMFVVKSNDLIRNGRYSLTLQQQKLLLYAISRIKPTDAVDTWYEFSITEMCRTCGLNVDDSGYYYHALKNDLLKLTERKWGVTPGGGLKTISWIGDVDLDVSPGIARIIFNPNMQPYLFELKMRYTQYRLENVLLFKCTYSVRLYELMRSYTTQSNLDNGIPRCVTMEIDELKSCLDVEGYDEWNDFNRYVIRKAVNEINTLSDEMNLQYRAIRNGRKIGKIIFTIDSSLPIQHITVRAKLREKL